MPSTSARLCQGRFGPASGVIGLVEAALSPHMLTRTCTIMLLTHTHTYTPLRNGSRRPPTAAVAPVSRARRPLPAPLSLLECRGGDGVRIERCGQTGEDVDTRHRSSADSCHLGLPRCCGSLAARDRRFGAGLGLMTLVLLRVGDWSCGLLFGRSIDRSID